MDLPQNILSKISALKAMRDHPNSNVHEAAEAAAKLQELLFKYNLQLSELNLDEKKSGYVKERLDLGDGDIAWKRDLSFAVAKYNFCKCLYTHDVDSRGRLHRVPWMIIVGEPHNIEMVRYLMDYISGEILRLAKENCQGKGRSVSTQFKYGAVQGVSEVLREQWEKDRQAEVQTMALVVVKDKDLMDATKKLVGGFRPMNISGGTGGNGFSQGKEAGRQIQIRKGVSTSGSTVSGYLT